ncbi:uncharacterized protein [Blastocystis hominis]|uniref:Vacuolar protein-sorting-associated protein 25 n=1 Tax=Blastocystis hominis TaxID=12968 RepID=D8LYH0_BLAHO|nr:uncharacterized protein [Blastocystis hominis]CBK20625.2 unnamed protein product [Blastocystis hominis]|eukprot:XP_012894673.1 uncharacterized protein [Blastocystis hominis]
MSTSGSSETPFLNFPPFYTLQPCLETRQKQLQMWVKYVIDYCKTNGVAEIVLSSFPLFDNRSINRSLSEEMRLMVMDLLCSQGYGHCERPGVYSVVQQSVKDWAYKIYNWMISNGYRMEVMDLEDIRCGDRVCHETFYNMQKSIFNDCIDILIKDGKVCFLTSLILLLYRLNISPKNQFAFCSFIYCLLFIRFVKSIVSMLYCGRLLSTSFQTDLLLVFPIIYLVNQ